MKNKKPLEHKKLPLQARILGLVSFFNDAASEMIFPLLPLFVTQTLGLGPHVLGLMEGIAETAAAFLKFLSGWWSDKLKRRKPLAVAGYALASVLRPFFAVVTTGWHIVMLRSLDRVGKGLRTAPRDALLADAVDIDQRGRAFGFHRAMDHAGAVVGPLIAFILMSGFAVEIRTVFLVSLIPGIITIFFIAVLVREKSRVFEALQTNTVTGTTQLSPAGRRSFRIFLAAVLLFTLGNSSDIFLVLHAHELGVPAAFAPLLWMVLHLSKTLWSTPCGSLSDRFGRKPVILAGWLVYSLAYLGFACATDAWQIWPLLIFYGLYYGLCEGPEKALAADLVPRAWRGRGFGYYHLAISAAALPASAAAGYLWKDFGAGVALGVGALAALLASALLGFGLKENSSTREA